MSNEAPELLIGPYTEQIRTDYINYRRARYLIDHPEAKLSQASQAARLGWRGKVKKAIQVRENQK